MDLDVKLFLWMKKMKITLIRHLPTEWNDQALLQGRKDINLPEKIEDHLEMIKKNKQLIEKNKPYDLVIASSLTRTYQTAKLYEYKPIRETLLDELDFGIYEGLPRQKLIDAFADCWIEKPDTIMLGESVMALERRIQTFLQKYKTYTNILLFGHGAWIRAFISYNQNGNISDMNKIKVHFNHPIIVDIKIDGSEENA